MRRLGIDHGQRRVGLAVSDEEGHIAHPRRTLGRSDPDALLRAVADVVREEDVGEVIVGLPLNLDGSEGASARRAKRFAERLGGVIERPVILWDERMTTALAERALRDSGVRGRERRGVVDQVAAALMLQSYLDSKREGQPDWRGSEPTAEDEPAAPSGRRRRGGRSRGR